MSRLCQAKRYSACLCSAVLESVCACVHMRVFVFVSLSVCVRWLSRIWAWQQEKIIIHNIYWEKGNWMFKSLFHQIYSYTHTHTQIHSQIIPLIIKILIDSCWTKTRSAFKLIGLVWILLWREQGEGFGTEIRPEGHVLLGTSYILITLQAVSLWTYELSSPNRKLKQ